MRVHYEILNQKGTPAFYSDTYTNRPTYGFAGRVFISTDTGQIFEDTGSAWSLIADAGVGGGTLSSVCANGNTTATGIVITAGGLSSNSITNTSLTTGSIIYAGTGGLMSQSNSTFFWDSTNNRLGINNASPGAPLDVHGTGTQLQLNGTGSSNSYIQFQNAGVSKWRIGNTYSAGANSYGIYNNGLSSLALTINSTNNNITLTGNVTASTYYSSAGIFLSTGGQASAGGGYATINGGTNYLDFRTANGGIFLFSFPYNTTRTFTLPDTTGTIALTSNLSSYVPYTGATTNVDLGVNDFTSRYVNSQFAFIQGNGTMGGVLGFTQYATSYTTTTNNTNIYAIGNNKINFSFYQIGGAFKIFNFDVSSLDTTNTRSYTLPNATGTLALTSDLSSYLPLTGGTLTGQLYINPTNTGTIGLDVASDNVRFRSDNLEGNKRQLLITMGSGTLVQLTAQGYGANYGTDLAFYTATTGGVNSLPGIYITSGNKIGILNGSPSTALDVTGTITATGLSLITSGSTSALIQGTGTNVYSSLSFQNTTTGYGYDIGFGGSSSIAPNSFYIYGGSSASVKFIINSLGLVGIGTTPLTGQKLVVNIASTQNIRFSQEGGQATISGVNGDASAFAYLNIDANVLRLQSNSGGNTCIATATDFGYKLNLNGQPGCNGYTAWTNWSDIRLKQNVTDFDSYNVLEKISKIRPVTYNYNELSGFDEETRNRRISGFIAQELKEVFPDMVGTIKKDDVEYYDTNLSNLDLYLVKAIQEIYKKLLRNNIN